MSVVINDPAAGIVSAAPPENWLGAWATSADCTYCRNSAGRILAANLSFARKFGRASATLAEAQVAEFMHPDDLAGLHATAADLLRPPHRASSQHRWVTPQGVRWFAWDEVAICDDAGAIAAIRAVGRNITRQKLA